MPSSSARGRVAVSECSEPSDWESNPHSLSRSRYHARRFTTVLGKRHMKIIAAKCFAYRCICACTTRECRTHENTRAEGPEELLVARWCAGVGGSTLPPRARARPPVHPPTRVKDVTVFWVKFVFARFSPGKVRGTSLYLYERNGERFSMGGAAKSVSVSAAENRRWWFRRRRAARTDQPEGVGSCCAAGTP